MSGKKISLYSDGRHILVYKAREQKKLAHKQEDRAVKYTKLPVAIAASFGLFALSAMTAAAESHQTEPSGQEYTPTIWIDPDGCQHWVMDDGFEGYMSPHRTRDGRPVCNRSEICGVIPTDTLFATNSAGIGRNQRQQLTEWFQSADAFGFLIYGHTDARASDEYNMALSNRRANSVADIARDAGLRVVDVKGFGERLPRAAGSSAEAYKQNRRVEIYCLK